MIRGQLPLSLGKTWSEESSKTPATNAAKQKPVERSFPMASSISKSSLTGHRKMSVQADKIQSEVFMIASVIDGRTLIMT